MKTALPATGLVRLSGMLVMVIAGGRGWLLRALRCRCLFGGPAQDPMEEAPARRGFSLSIHKKMEFVSLKKSKA